MNLLKKYLWLSILLVSQYSMAQICVNTSSNYRMFGSAPRVGALANGHELAFQKNTFLDHQEFSSESEADFAKQIQKMSSGSCSIILGLFTSRDCLISGPLLKTNKIIGISSTCGHDNISLFSPYLYTIIPPISVFSDKTSTYLNNRHSSEKLFVIYQPTDVYSKTSHEDFKKGIKKPIIEIPVTSNGHFHINKFSINPKEHFTLVFFTYALPSAKILMQLSTHQIITKKTTIIGASCWTFDVTVFRPLRSILEKAKRVLATDVLDWNTVKKTEFVTNFTARFNRKPLTIEILTYDVTQLAINCYKKSLVNNQYNRSRFQNCMTNTQHQGVSGSFSFSKDSPFAERPLYLSNFFDRM